MSQQTMCLTVRTTHPTLKLTQHNPNGVYGQTKLEGEKALQE